MNTDFHVQEFEQDPFRKIEVQVCHETRTVQFGFLDHTGDGCCEGPHPVALPFEVAERMLAWILAKVDPKKLPELVELLDDAWGDIHELVRHSKYLRDGGTMFITDNGIEQSEEIIERLKSAGRKLRMWQEGVTEEDLHIPYSEKP